MLILLSTYVNCLTSYTATYCTLYYTVFAVIMMGKTRDEIPGIKGIIQMIYLSLKVKGGNYPGLNLKTYPSPIKAYDPIIGPHLESSTKY